MHSVYGYSSRRYPGRVRGQIRRKMLLKWSARPRVTASYTVRSSNTKCSLRWPRSFAGAAPGESLEAYALNDRINLSKKTGQTDTRPMITPSAMDAASITMAIHLAATCAAPRAVRTETTPTDLNNCMRFD